MTGAGDSKTGDEKDKPSEEDKTEEKKPAAEKEDTYVKKPIDKTSTKNTDFQVRIKVIEGRQLQGANIDPVARITCYNQTKQTRVQKSTNAPYWNEMFFFNFVCSPAELFEETINFQVFHAKKLRSDSLVGNFKCDVSMVYDAPNHTFLNKWLLLSDPEDPQAGATGYLKISATVLGSGDEAPSFKQIAQDEDDDEDIESNLLRPAGVQLRPATFHLNLYRCEDLPVMDADLMGDVKKFFGSKEKRGGRVDPYFVFSFAGAEVRSQIMEKNDHPEYNENLNLGLRFPSMCEKIKFQLRDWDRLSEDDPIGTAFVYISHISATGESGFLPTYGPTYINFYGSPREFSALCEKYEYLNTGKGEGVAYRGRALLELTTVVGDLPEEASEALSVEQTCKVEKYMARRKFKLNAAFMNATMIYVQSATVQFEVSIGNYGNILDESVPPSASTTQITNPVFDGCYYYFLPWGETKPCTSVDCQWEDISHRLEALNSILKTVARLESNIEKIKMAMKARVDIKELAQIIISTLDSLVNDCQKPLPKIIEGHTIQNDLDRELRSYRETELASLQGLASSLRTTADDPEKALGDIEGYLAQLRNLAIEPQQSIPDVIIWMISENERKAYFRLPVHHVLYSPTPDYCGKFCNNLETIQLQFPGDLAEKDSKWEIPALLRAKLWFGLERYEESWHKDQTEGEVAVFAETYENEVKVMNTWSRKMLTRPNFSDSSGKMKLMKEDFIIPDGWSWDGNWYISPELSMLYDKDSGHTTYIEEVYEMHARTFGGNWDMDSSAPWTDVKGDKAIGKGDIELPKGWEWDNAWDIDKNRAVDDDGWEYCTEVSVGGWGPVEKMYHLCRRRRWLRTRKLAADAILKAQKEEEAKKQKALAEGWEYAPVFDMKFHHTERKLDMVRRRRWHRKLQSNDSKKPCFFKFKDDEKKEQKREKAGKKDGEKSRAKLAAPRMFLTCPEPTKYQLRAYIYQARNLLAADANGLSDPFGRVAFLNQSAVTERLENTLCPTWDQTLIFEKVSIHGRPNQILEKPPTIIIEFFDHDQIGSPEYLGRTVAYPLVKLDVKSDTRIPSLQWYKIKKGFQDGGEVLAAFELLRIDGQELPHFPPKRKKLYTVPPEVRPRLRRTGVEVLCWGVRNMKKYHLLSVTSPSIEFEIGGHLLKSKVIKDTKKNPNFDEPLLFFDIMLPEEELYTPPMNINVRDNRQFGRKPLVGIHVLRSFERFRYKPPPKLEEVTSETESVLNAAVEILEDKPPEKKSNEALWEEDIDWWSKYYASLGEHKKCNHYLEMEFDTLQVFPKALEKVESIEEFSDFCKTFELSRGKNVDDEQTAVGEFKGTFVVYPLPDDPSEPLPDKVLSHLPSSAPEECIVRVYIIKAYELQPSDPNGLADPYITVKIGKKKVNNRKEYLPNTLEPVFGKMFELKANIPMEKDLIIRVKDYDLLSTDDVIGETVIDLENRYLSRYRATVGLPKTYCTSGPTQWRDSQTPKEILKNFCVKNCLPDPIYTSVNDVVTVKIGPNCSSLTDFEKVPPKHSHLGPDEERLALYVLNTLPASLNNPLIVEHVETRPLFNPLQPDIEQGKLELFVDIFPVSLGPPGPQVDITPRKPKKFELRVVIWNTTDVILEETSITGEKMSDIYVKGWLQGVDQVQSTDVHYRSLDGDGNFNWRMVFPFNYIPAEECLHVKRKEHFWSLDETELLLPPVLVLQIWDNDKFSADDFLGTVELNLNKMPSPAKSSRKCNLNQIPDPNNPDSHSIKMISIFEQKRISGFWPCFNDETGIRELTGKVEIEMELIPSQEAAEKPVGLGQEEPNQYPKLDPPKRPATSFLWFTSPWKTLKLIIWKNYKWYFISGFAILLLIIFFVLFIYTIPGASVNAMFG